MTHIRIVTAFSLALLLAAAFVVVVQAVPPIPYSVYGNAVLNGEDAPVGTEVVAVISGSPRATTTVTTYQSASVFALLIPGDNNWNAGSGDPPDEGETVTFLLGDGTAVETTVWSMGESQPLTLTATSPQAPTFISFSDATGETEIGVPTSITFVANDANGAADILALIAIANNWFSGLEGMSIRYVPDEDKLLLNDPTGGVPWLDSCTLGTAKTLNNGYVEIDCNTASEVLNGTTMTLTLPITVLQPFSGRPGMQRVYTRMADKGGLIEDWAQKGTWLILSTTPGFGPAEISPDPVLADQQQMTFQTVFYDLDGYTNLNNVFGLLNIGSAGANAFYGRYWVSGNTLYLRNQSGLPGTVGSCTPGEAKTISHEFAILNCAGTTVQASGHTLTVTWALTPTAAFSGRASTQKAYVLGSDMSGNQLPPTLVGNWAFTPQPPVTESAAGVPAEGTLGQTVIFTTTYSDPDGFRNIAAAYLLMNRWPSSVEAMLLRYQYMVPPLPDRFFIRRLDGKSWETSCNEGAAETRSTTKAVLDCAQTSAIGYGDTLTVTWAFRVQQPLGANGGTLGPYNTYLRAVDRQGQADGWNVHGTWQLEGASGSAPASDSIGRGLLLPADEQALLEEEEARLIEALEQQVESSLSVDDEALWSTEEPAPPEPTPAPTETPPAAPAQPNLSHKRYLPIIQQR